MLTEEEAKTKWCPMARVPAFTVDGSIVGSFNDPQEQQSGAARCLGSGCMMWRPALAWTPPGARESGGGYCGLAGRPDASALRGLPNVSE